MSNLPNQTIVPAFQTKNIQRSIRESISRISTGLNVIGGNKASYQTMANTLKAHGKSFEVAAVNSREGIDLLTLAETAVTEINNLATRLRELSIESTKDTITTNETAALSAESISVSDTIDSIVTSLTFNDINILGTSSKTFNVAIDDEGNTSTIKTTDGISATNVTVVPTVTTTADTTISEVTTSLGNIAGSLQSLMAYQNIASTSAAQLLEAAANLEDTDFAAETAKLTKNSILNNYALAMVAHGNQTEKDKLKLLA
ncbi:MAG: hypothetical protein CMM91_07055 [Rickettsiales bacterium]|nr:hypothetical protein [Rickettsiales bacterium]|tara:strand:- start:2731 stop:3507 length:777 start_codon:yes stop_codon:yes gene_type:complete